MMIVDVNIRDVGNQNLFRYWTTHNIVRKIGQE